MEKSLLILDPELKKLLDKFAAHHPEGSKDVLKLVLKLYLKLLDRSKSGGLEPLLVFQELVERVVSGNLYRTTKDKIDHLNILLEKREEQATNFDSPHLYNEIREIKNFIREIKIAKTSTAESVTKINETRPKDAAKLIVTDKAKSVESRVNYRNIRKQAAQKKIKF